MGISVVNALSENLEVTVIRNKKIYSQKYSRGIVKSNLEYIEKQPKKVELLLNLPPTLKYLVQTFHSHQINCLKNVNQKHIYYQELK